MLEQGYEPSDGIIHEPDYFVWHPKYQQTRCDYQGAILYKCGGDEANAALNEYRSYHLIRERSW